MHYYPQRSFTILLGAMNSSSGNILLYDGDCPLCSRAADFYRVRQAFPGLQLISMRESEVLKQITLPPGIRLDTGMVLLKSDGTLLQGEQALRALNRALRPQNPIAQLFQKIITQKWLSAGLYPLAKLSRRISLFLLGRSAKIQPPNSLE